MTKQWQEDYWYSVPECLLTRQYNDAYSARNAKSSFSNQCPNLIDKNARIPFERNTERPVPICKYIQECLLTKQCQNAYWQSNTKIPINKATPKISIDKAMAWWLFMIQIFPVVLSAHFTHIISRTYSLFLPTYKILLIGWQWSVVLIWWQWSVVIICMFCWLLVWYEICYFS